MRLQVYLSSCGACSRRKALTCILEGAVSVNGKKVLEPSFSVSPTDSVIFAGKPVLPQKKSYILLNKPKGVITTTKDRFAPKIIIDLLPKELRHLNPVGRLDQDTVGLILLTNDGELAFRLSHPSFEAQKVYRVILDKPLLPEHKSKIEKGVLLDEKTTSFCKIKDVAPKEVDIVLHEGRKRQVRRMFSVFGYKVIGLCRIQQGSLTLGNLKEGEWRFLTQAEVDVLRKELKIL